MQHPAWLYVSIGHKARSLYETKSLQDLIDVGRPFINDVKHAGFQQALDQMGELELAVKNAEAVYEKSAGDLRAQYIQNTIGLKHWVDAIQRALFAEARNRQLAIILPSSVSNALRPILGRAKSDMYKTLIQETINGLECGSHRSAIVMAWSAAIEQIRRDILSNPQKLQTFNTALTKPNAKGKQDDPIKEYEDFFDLLDWKLLDIGRQANVIDKHLFETLDIYRNRRNHFGHPTLETATLPIAEAFVDTLRTTVFEKLPVP